MNYEDSIIIVKSDLTEITLKEWQKEYGLSGTQIGKHYSYMERTFRRNIEDYGSLVVYADLMRVLDAYREISGKPCRVASFNRSEAKQEDLRRRGYKAAKTSPHVAKMAADVDLLTEAEVREAVAHMHMAAAQTGVKCRFGWRTYLPKQTFVHLDVCPEYYGKGGLLSHTPHPKVWEAEIEW